jgi:pimeloyl-ACP methyl ester carboxylesterase
VFDIVAPSLPNFAFSSGVTKLGFALSQYAQTCHKLMLALGYDQYVTQGGDSGGLITHAIAHLYPKHCKACRVNWIFACLPKWTESSPEPEYSDREKAALGRAQDLWAGDRRE